VEYYDNHPEHSASFSWRTITIYSSRICYSEHDSDFEYLQSQIALTSGVSSPKNYYINMEKLVALFQSKKMKNWGLVSIFIILLFFILIDIPVILKYFFQGILYVYILAQFITSIKILPKIDNKDLLFKERTASGFSHLNFATRLGGASRVLKVQITSQKIVFSSWFPFSLIASVYDGIHVIPISQISEIQRPRFPTNSFSIAFKDQEGDNRKFTVRPNNYNKMENIFKKLNLNIKEN
jgi:hypothetical protein